jgi:alpha-1,2-mannosyltransferase
VPATAAELDGQCRLQRLSSWVFWCLWATIILVAAAFYYEKASDQRSAFVRWRPQVLQFWTGVNIYDKMIFPNPPIMPITLYPLMVLPTVAGAMCWFAIKVALTTATLVMLFRVVQPSGRPFPMMFRSLVLLLSLRPILGDLHHGNNNLLILFLVVATFYAWRRGYDIGAGLLLGLAAAYKVTPALFLVYFAYKRSWRTVSWGILGLGIFLLIVPSMVIGPQFNGECLGHWWHRMVTPFVVNGVNSPQFVNQSLPGVLSRLFTNLTPGQGPYQVSLNLNLTSWPPWLVAYLIKGLDLTLVGLLAVLCRIKVTDRRDPRLLGEVALVVLTMLFVSERSWKHHYVTVVIPYIYLVAEFFSARVTTRGRAILAAAWATSFTMMLSTSTEVGQIFAEGQGHEIAQGYGMFLWAGVVLYAMVAWRVWVSRSQPEIAPETHTRAALIPRSHLPTAATTQVVVTS